MSCVLLVTARVVTQEYGEDPRIAAVPITAAFVERLAVIGAFCESNGVSAAVLRGEDIRATFGAPDVFPMSESTEFERSNRLGSARCEVSGIGEVVWIRPDRDDAIAYETEPVSIADLASALQAGASVVCFRHGRYDPRLGSEVEDELLERAAELAEEQDVQAPLP